MWLDLQCHGLLDLQSVFGVHDAGPELHCATDWEAQRHLSDTVSMVRVKPGCGSGAVGSELDHTSQHTGPAVDVVAHDHQA